MRKRRSIGISEIMTDTTQSKIHLCQTIFCDIFLLPVHIDAADIALFGLNKIYALNKHTAGHKAKINLNAVFDTKVSVNLRTR